MAAKQAEREQTRLNEIEELTEDDGETTTTDEDSKAHLIPEIVITEPETEAAKTDQKKYKQNSAKTYAELSKKLAERMSHEKAEETDNQRQNWRNKEIKKSKSEAEPKPKSELTSQEAKPTAASIKAAFEQPKDEVITFSKTYSFKNLPKGKVAKFREQFEANPDEKPVVKQMVYSTPLPHLGRVKKGPSSRPALKGILEDQAKPMVPIGSWEDDFYVRRQAMAMTRQQPSRSEWPTEKSFEEFLKQPGSRQGFHASTPALTAAMDQNLNKETSLSTAELQRESSQFSSTYIKDYLDALREKRDKARQQQRTSSECKKSTTTVKQPSNPLQQKSKIKERYYAFENIDLTGRVISWTEIISVHSFYDVSISEPVFV